LEPATHANACRVDRAQGRRGDAEGASWMLPFLRRPLRPRRPMMHCGTCWKRWTLLREGNW
jgi:hypothetical protein